MLKPNSGNNCTIFSEEARQTRAKIWFQFAKKASRTCFWVQFSVALLRAETSTRLGNNYHSPFPTSQRSNQVASNNVNKPSFSEFGWVLNQSISLYTRTHQSKPIAIPIKPLAYPDRVYSVHLLAFLCAAVFCEKILAFWIAELSVRTSPGPAQPKIRAKNGPKWLISNQFSVVDDQFFTLCKSPAALSRQPNDEDPHRGTEWAWMGTHFF